MIQYALKCSEGHSFDSWFQSAEAFDKLSAAGMVACAVCGSSKVEKAIMTPRVRPARNAVKQAGEASENKLSDPASAAEQALAELRRKIEANADYVGKDFADEARKIHLGEAPERSIYGEARADEAKALAEEGVPVALLPFVPNRKTN
ncbi:hypothetical protein AVO45_05335 [Ruegeria marisrubri]|uniref:DUF1178 family protein n=1 Tax=Ruegeria marisrubri TaxID=1685379 RepID=A0A0X3TXT0_9RHOB|nr:DUF1178 family protein [Ruegeria marisrubri]KUJ80474.1 hypothetical protein AVO45_05335 [Ruegeria marisrubri]